MVYNYMMYDAFGSECFVPFIFLSSPHKLEFISIVSRVYAVNTGLPSLCLSYSSYSRLPGVYFGTIQQQ